MSKVVRRFTLQEFVAAIMPESWARYRSASDTAPMKPWQKSRTIPEALAEYWSPEIKEANSKAKLAYRAIVNELKDVLPHYEVVADDASHKCVLLERRHWADAIFEFENNAIRHGDQRWTNVEVRTKAQRVEMLRRPAERPATPSPFPTRRRKAGSRLINDDRHIKRFLSERRRNPNLTVRAFVMRHTRKIEGASDDAKVRRFQRKLEDVD
jgi:hypothetical protein